MDEGEDEPEYGGAPRVHAKRRGHSVASPRARARAPQSSQRGVATRQRQLSRRTARLTGDINVLPASARTRDKHTTTLESKTNFIGRAPVGTRLIGTATPLHRGRTTQIWETHIRTEDGKLVAKVTQTQLVM